MRILPRKKTYKIIISIILCGILIFSASAIYVYGFNGEIFGWTSRVKDVNYDEPSEEERSAGSDIKKETIESEASSKEDQPNTDTNTGNGSETGVIITALNQTDQSLQVRTLIQSLAEGSCSLRASGPGGQTKELTADTQVLPNGTTCKGFDIPLSELNSGEWTVAIHYTSEGAFGNAEQKITIN